MLGHSERVRTPSQLAAVKWFGIFAILSIFFLSPATASAHSRSISYSTWHLDETTATAEFRIDSRNVAELIVGPGLEAGSIGAAEFRQMRQMAPQMVATGVVVSQNGQPCEVTVPNEPAQMAQTTLLTSGSFVCPQPFSSAGINIDVDLLPDLGIGHSHLMRVHIDDHRYEAALGGFHSSWSLQGGQTTGGTAWQTIETFVQSGVTHILGGYDHLAFLFTLMLLVAATSTTSRNLLRDILVVATSFTIGHSLTLVLAVTGTVEPNSGLVELLVAISIAVLAFEGFLATSGRKVNVRACYTLILASAPVAALFGVSGQPVWVLLGMSIFAIAYLELTTRTNRPRTLRGAVALIFGLVHGFGFAGLLTEMGLSGTEMALSLVSFNVGVELGQSLILFIVLWPLLQLRKSPQRIMLVQVGCSITLCMACFWMGARVLG